ncbi:hypothetical protein EIP86_010052 [Pleurotus ostreatoroseus]|nr:hypothetical protein EIP86_010052 [Pleurotus ostreatoroseus]
MSDVFNPPGIYKLPVEIIDLVASGLEDDMASLCCFSLASKKSLSIARRRLFYAVKVRPRKLRYSGEWRDPWTESLVPTPSRDPTFLVDFIRFLQENPSVAQCIHRIKIIGDTRRVKPSSEEKIYLFHLDFIMATCKSLQSLYLGFLRISLTPTYPTASDSRLISELSTLRPASGWSIKTLQLDQLFTKAGPDKLGFSNYLYILSSFKTIDGLILSPETSETRSAQNIYENIVEAALPKNLEHLPKTIRTIYIELLVMGDKGEQDAQHLQGMDWRAIREKLSSLKQLGGIQFNLRIAEISRQTVAEFFAKTGISIRTWKIDLESTTERRVREIVASWDLGDVTPERYGRIILSSITAATTVYGHTHPDVQVHIALFTVLILTIDDLEINTEALQQFVQRLQTGTPQLHSVLTYLAENLQHLPEYFPPYAASAIFAATVQFVNSTVFDKELENMPLTKDSLPYVLYKRARNSLGEVYGFMVWDKFAFPDISAHIQVIHDTMTYLNYANDILSFYKEELAGETANFVHDLVKVNGKSIPEVLSEILQEVTTSVERARVLLKGEKEKEVWEKFIAGYVVYHFYSPRYKLVELTGTEYTA